ncbi:MAG: hypothetical protein QM726_14450 [Chitinophagaceae bacterium]
MVKCFSLLLSIFFALQSFAQNEKVNVSFYFKTTGIKDSADLDFLVKYVNNRKEATYVYKSLEHGNMNNPSKNIHFELQKLVGGNYKTMPRESDAVIPDFDRDAAFYASVEKFAPGETKTLRINLLQLFYEFDEGYYRIQANLLKIPIDEEEDRSMKYEKSKYYYFRISQDIYKLHKN